MRGGIGMEGSKQRKSKMTPGHGQHGGNLLWEQGLGGAEESNGGKLGQL